MTIHKENTLLGSISGIVHYDYEVFMPKKGAQQRAEELALLSGIIHKRNTNPKIGSLLAEIKSINSEDEVYEEIAEKVNSIMFASRL